MIGLSIIFLIIINSVKLQEIVTIENDFKAVGVIGNYSTDITVTVHSKKEYVIHFRKSTSVYPYIVYATSSQASIDYPVFVMVRQQREVTSWEIPLSVDSKEGTLHFWNVSRTLCHNNMNTIAHMKIYNNDTVQKDKFYKHITVSVSTVSMFPTNVTIRVEEEKDFYIKENTSYSVTISPNQPKYFYYQYEKSNSENETNVILEVDSYDETCLTVSIQNATCPIFDLNEDITYEGKYETVNTKGGIIIKRYEYPRGFFIIFVAKGDNYDCNRKHSLIPLQKVRSKIKPSNHSSIVIFKIKADITKIDYLNYTFLTLGILLGLFLLFGGIAYTSLHFQIKYRRRPTVVQENNRSLNAELPQNDADTSPLLNEFLDNIFTIPQETVVEVIHNDSEINIETTTSNYQSCISHNGETTENLENSVTLKKRRLRLTRPTLDDLVIKKPKIIYKESMNYCLNSLTIGIFYGIPVVQLVIIHSRLLEETGNLDICYYNFLCAHPYGIFNDYNHVLSNAGYICFGLLFLIITGIKHYKMPYIESCGIPKQYGNFYALGVALIMEGILSGCYHVCPNQSNFQFDTSFMYIMVVMCIVKVYQNRHPGINANAYLTFLILSFAVLIAMVGILNGSLWIWIVFIVAYILFSIYLVMKIYFMDESKQGLASFIEALRGERPQEAFTPARKTWRNYLMCVLVINIVMASLGFYFYKHDMDFGTFLLFLLMGNAILYTLFYIVVKFAISRSQKRSGREATEKPTLESLCYLFLAIITWIVAAIFFCKHSTEWMVSPAESKQENTECKVMDFYDYHDIWHLTSSSALFFSFMLLLTIDDNLVYTPRNEIVVF